MPIPRFLEIKSDSSNSNSGNMAYRRSNGKTTEDVLDEFHRYQMEDYAPSESDDEDTGDFKGGDYQQYAEGILMQRLMAKEEEMKGKKRGNTTSSAALLQNQKQFLLLIAILFVLLCSLIITLVFIFKKK